MDKPLLVPQAGVSFTMTVHPIFDKGFDGPVCIAIQSPKNLSETEYVFWFMVTSSFSRSFFAAA